MRRDRTWMRAADFFVAADYGIELARCAPASVRSRAYFFSASYWFSAVAESAVRPCRRSLMALFSACAETPASFSAFDACGARLHGDGLQHAFRGDEAVARLLRQFLRLVEQFRRFLRQINLRRRALDLGQFGQRHLDLLQRLLRAPACRRDEARGHALFVVEQRLQKVFGREKLVVGADGDALRGLDEAARPLGEFLEIHDASSGLPAFSARQGKSRHGPSGTVPSLCGGDLRKLKGGRGNPVRFPLLPRLRARRLIAKAERRIAARLLRRVRLLRLLRVGRSRSRLRLLAALCCAAGAGCPAAGPCSG